MKKIKKLKFVELNSQEQSEILGGCHVDFFGNAHCCVGTNQASIPTANPPVYTPVDPSPTPKPSACNSCGGTCMPGDNADFAVWAGTKLANQAW